MPRTEKKFGQVRRAASGQLHSLVPIANTTRNVLLNLTANTSSTAATVITTTGPISRVVSSAAISGSSSGFATTFASSHQFYSISKAGTTAVATANGTGIYFGIPFTPSTLTFGSGTQITDTTLAARVNALTNISNVQSAVTLGQTTAFTSTGKWLGGFVVFTPMLPLSTLVATYQGNTDQKMYVVFNGTTGAQVGSMTATRGIGKFLAEVTPARSYTRPWGVYDLDNGSSTTGLGYLLGSTNALSDQVPASSNNEAEALAMVVFKDGVDIGHVWWDSVAGRTSGDALAFYQTSDINSLTGQFVFSHTSNPSNPWLAKNASGTSGTLFASGTTPFLPTRHSPSGFRIVEADGSQGPNRSWLDGSVTIPSAPTGVDVPTAAQLLAAGLYCPVAATKFSPNGYYLAVAYNLNDGSSVAKSRIVIYSKQSNNTWVHTHSSGTSVTISPEHTDAMVWSADSATISIAKDGVIQTWSPGNLTNSPKLLGVGATLSLVGIYPNVPSIASVSATDTYVLGADVETFNNAGQSNSPTKQLFSINRGSNATPAVLLLYKDTNNLLTGSLITAPFTSQTYAVSASGSDTYQNTVAQSVTASSGSVLQISNIVLSPGEGLYIEPTTTGRLEAVAYGVEIT
jgi:hypothetical protein